jgi:fructose-1,6-bisphosphatase II / sedoheptulose-1,7-bisphosphatase
MSKASARAKLELIPAFDIVKITESSAVAAAKLRGRGDEAAADDAAALAMYRELMQLPIAGTVVVGEGEQGEIQHLFIGETIGAEGSDAPVELAVDPIEGSTLCAKALPNALSVIAIAEPGSFLKVPDIYMDKIAIGPGFEEGLVDLDLSPKENLQRLAEAKGVKISEVTACILDRPRHGRLIEAVRQAGAAVRLIGDGDIAGVIHTTEPEDTGIDIYLGVGGAPEGVLAAAALCCIGGQMQGRLMATNDEQKGRAAALGIKNFDRKYSLADMVSGDVRFAATGITDGSLLEGVRFGKDTVSTHTLTMRRGTRTTRWIHSEHRDTSKFD